MPNIGFEKPCHIFYLKLQNHALCKKSKILLPITISRTYLSQVYIIICIANLISYMCISYM